MKVILKEDVKGLGHMGEVVNTSDGYARNYLLPKNLAAEASTKNIKELEHNRKIIMEKAAKIRDASRASAEKLAALTLVIKAKVGEEEKLFGSVTSMDIAEALTAQGFEIDKKKIHIDEPIKRIGEYVVHARIHPEVSAPVKVHVVSE
jgi:large subunit ribosomal protein L9